MLYMYVHNCLIIWVHFDICTYVCTYVHVYRNNTSTKYYLLIILSALFAYLFKSVLEKISICSETSCTYRVCYMPYNIISFIYILFLFVFHSKNLTHYATYISHGFHQNIMVHVQLQLILSKTVLN